MNYSGKPWFRFYQPPLQHPRTWPDVVLKRRGEANACMYLESYGYKVIGQDVILRDEIDEPWTIVDIVCNDPFGDRTLVDVRVVYSEDPNASAYDELERWGRWYLGVAVHKYLYEHSCEVNYVRQDLMTVAVLADGKIKVAHAIDVAHFGYNETGL